MIIDFLRQVGISTFKRGIRKVAKKLVGHEMVKGSNTYEKLKDLGRGLLNERDRAKHAKKMTKLAAKESRGIMLRNKATKAFERPDQIKRRLGMRK